MPKKAYFFSFGVIFGHFLVIFQIRQLGNYSIWSKDEEIGFGNGQLVTKTTIWSHKQSFGHTSSHLVTKTIIQSQKQFGHKPFQKTYFTKFTPFGDFTIKIKIIIMMLSLSK